MLNFSELKRNVWLEFSAQRLILMPVILGGILFFTHLGLEDAEITEYIETMTSRISILFALVLLVWGTVLVSRNINEELMQRSWDFQRMSALSGLEMTIGKCFGATAYAWYGGLLLIATHIGIEIYGHVPPEIIARNIAYFVFSGVFAHAAVLMFATLMLRNPEYRAKPRGRVLYSIVVIAYTAPLLFFSRGYNEIKGQFSPETLEHTWHGLAIAPDDMALISLIIYAGWAFFAAVRMVSSELQYRQASLGWPLFLLFSVGWYSGYDWVPETVTNNISAPTESIWAIIFSVLGLYAGLLFDRVHPANYRTWFHAMRVRNWGNITAMIPWWFSSYIILVISTIIAVAYGTENTASQVHPATYGGLLLCVVSRDIALYHALAFSGLRRVTGAFIVYAALLYGLVPLLLDQLEWAKAHALFLPDAKDFHAYSIASFALQALLLAGFCIIRYKQRKSAASA